MEAATTRLRPVLMTTDAVASLGFFGRWRSARGMGARISCRCHVGDRRRDRGMGMSLVVLPGAICVFKFAGDATCAKREFTETPKVVFFFVWV